MDQMKMLMLVGVSLRTIWLAPDKPHPFPDRPPLKSQVLWVLENEVGEIKDRPEPVELVCRKAVRFAECERQISRWIRSEGKFTHMIPSTAD
jgi:hypothetical protein